LAKIIIFDSDDPLAKQNRIFNPEYTYNQPGRSALVLLHQTASACGVEIVTSDIFLSEQPRGNKPLILSEMITTTTQTLVSNYQAVPTICFCWESPNAVWSFYHNLERNVRDYQHAFLFRGAKERVKDPTRFYPVFWPMPTRTVLDGPEWSQRDYLVMVVSNKHRFAVSPHRPAPEIRQRLKQLLWGYLQLADPIFRLPDLYHIRLKAILSFLNVEGFKLFGTGWEKPNGLKRQTWQAIQTIKPRPVDNKLQTLSNFKFTLCFENCVFPGYVTEKIFDAFLSGCIPIYLGAPDITDFVPSDTFIDVRHFQDLSELHHFLSQISEAEAVRYLEAARDFLNSPAFDKFTDQQNAVEMFNIFDQAF